MIRVYTEPNNNRCRTAMQMLNSYGIDYKKIDGPKDGITKDEIMHILALTENGFSDIISYRKERFKSLVNSGLYEMSTSSLVQYVHDNPEILRYPIVVDDQRLHIGYHLDTIRQFMPVAQRRARLAVLTH
jgi:Spx/MgsR family transcriptional regulator